MIDILRKSLELFRIIPRRAPVDRVTPTPPRPDQIVTGDMTIVRDGVDKMGQFPLSRWVRRDHQAVPQQEPEAILHVQRQSCE